MGSGRALSQYTRKRISKDLANNVRDMGWGAARFAANTMFGRQEEAERQMKGK